MDVREKLALSVCNATQKTNYKCDFNCEKKGKCAYCLVMAEQIIAHGVTVQELDGCEYCKEDREGCRKMFGAFSITNPFHGNEWLINTGHCKPRQIYFCPMCGRKLPQPPKGE